MNTYPRLLAIVLLLSNVTTAFAASFVEITVTGRLTPDACHVELSDEGMVDYGKIPAHTLNPNEFTMLPSRLLELSVQCSRPMLFALVGVDNRAESSLGPSVYSLGRNIHVPAERLGSVALSYRNPLGDALSMQALASSDNGETWAPAPNAPPDPTSALLPPVIGSPTSSAS